MCYSLGSQPIFDMQQTETMIFFHYKIMKVSKMLRLEN